MVRPARLRWLVQGTFNEHAHYLYNVALLRGYAVLQHSNPPLA